MPTTVTKSIKASGGDYATIALWFAACPADLTSVDQIWKGELYNENYNESWDWSGIACDATRYLWLTVAAGNKHNGKPYTTGTTYSGAAVSWNGAVSTAAWYLNSGRVRISDIIFDVKTGFTNNRIGLGAYHTYQKISNCIFIQSGTSTGITMIETYQSTGDPTYNSDVFNNIVVGIGTNRPVLGINMYRGNVYNNSVYNCVNGIYGTWPSGANIATNNIASCTTKDYDTSAMTTTYNCSSDTTATGTGSIISQSASSLFTDTSTSNPDLSLKSGAGAIGAATDLSSIFTKDIKDNTRATPWDMGAFMYIALATIKFRRTLSQLGAGIGKRQLMGV